MAYSIRYGPDGSVRRREIGVFRYQAATAAVLLAVTAALRLCWQGGGALTAEILASGPTTVKEMAVSALAERLAAGEEWYHALAVWCRTIIDAGLA